MSDQIHLRPFRPDDALPLARIYQNAVLTAGPAHYTPQQVETWASYPQDPGEFQHRLMHGTTLIAEHDSQPVAFGQLDPADHIAFLYCRGSHMRRGIATSIHQALEAHARRSHQVCLDTTASRISRPVFQSLGMQVVEREHPIRNGIPFERFRMAKLLFEPAATRWAILGNSASGKSTLARKIAELTGAAILDLDTIAWDPAAPQPTRRETAACLADIARFVAQHPAWIIEGCYEDLIAQTLQWDPAMVFLDPDAETCLTRARQREFEPHKFATPEKQNEALPFLLQWIEQYPTRPGPMSRSAHLHTFHSYPGKKIRAR